MAEDTPPPSPFRDSEVREFSSGSELTPVVPLDVRNIQNTSQLVAAMASTSFGARRVGEAAALLEHMARDRKTFTVLTVTGAMTVAKLGLLMSEMIDRGLVDAIVATGALITHGLVEGQGFHHYKVPPGKSDKELFELGYNRVYDTLETELNLDHTQKFLQKTLSDWDASEPMGTWEICREIGRKLVEEDLGRGPLASAYRRGVPVFIPAFTDSELGLDFQVNNLLRTKAGRRRLKYDAFKDLRDFADLIEAQDTTGIFTIGGGVPRNWAQQVGPYLDLRSLRTGGGNNFKPYKYAIRICPDPAHFGHLSGCTYSESVSWGKFVPAEDGGRWVEVLTDATIAWPLVVQAVCERLDAAGDYPGPKDLPGLPMGS